MAKPTTAAPATTPDKPWLYFALAMAGLAILLLISFHEGLGPNMVHFNNDAPFGMVKAREDSALSGLTGYWENLNWVGIEQPSGQPELGNLYYAFTGPELFCKTFPAFSLFFLGFSGWMLFRALKFHPGVCFAGALAAAYNTNSFSNACWGLGTWGIARGMILLALASIISHRDRPHWSKLALAGAAIGFNIMGAFDTGAIYSIYVAAFAFALALTRPEKTIAARAGKGVLNVSVIAVCAFLLAAHTVMNLVGTQVQGVAGMGQQEKEKAKRWDEATLWSLPKVETLRFVIPGLFGYRMFDVQNQTSKPSDYWGTVGAPDGAPQYRFSGSGEYMGILVVLLAAWALGQSFRKDGKDLGGPPRYIIWFCAITGFISLLCAFGRFAPVYQFIFSLPFFSTIRNPIKFTNPLHISVLIMFGYGLNNLVRSYFQTAEGQNRSWKEAWAAFRKLSDQYARKLTLGMFVLLGAFALGGMIYSSSNNEIISYMKTVGFDENAAKAMSSFSIMEVFTAVAFLGAAVLVIWGGMSGWLKGYLALGLLVSILAVDMVRSNAPWVKFYDYTNRYASNHIVDYLKDQSPYWRNAAEIAPMTRSYLLQPNFNSWGVVFNTWLQQHFQYYKIESLDISQMSRPPILEVNYLSNFRTNPGDTPNAYKIARLWELTSTRYILGQAGYIQILNQQFDPGKGRFDFAQLFQLAAKPGVQGNPGIDDITTVPSTNGPLAVFEFKGALPRAGLYTNWLSGLTNIVTYTNGPAVMSTEASLAILEEKNFDPATQVLLAETIPPPSATGAKPGVTNSVSEVNIKPRSVSMKVEVAQDSVLLLNDRHSPNWHVYVDGSERPLLRANYLMRGVQLKPGDKEVVFKFEPTAKYLKISFASIFVSFGLLIWWPLRERKQTDAAKPASAK
jgi:type IV secretory pathway TrbF-like protein